MFTTVTSLLETCEVPVVITLLLTLWLCYKKPTCAFDKLGKFRSFGIGIDENGNEKTLFTVYVLVGIVGVLVMFSQTMIN